jgi:PIN domain nuclease of toxin-antitoxin system
VLLLDTHTWIWSVEGDAKRVGQKTRRLLARGTTQGVVHISAVSLFEVAALHTAGRLRLSRPVEQWIRDAVQGVGLRVVDMSIDVAIDAGRIPREALADPLDRLLVATARQLDATFLTADAQILSYAARTRSVRVRPPGV